LNSIRRHSVDILNQNLLNQVVLQDRTHFLTFDGATIREVSSNGRRPLNRASKALFHHSGFFGGAIASLSRVLMKVVPTADPCPDLHE